MEYDGLELLVLMIIGAIALFIICCLYYGVRALIFKIYDKIHSNRPRLINEDNYVSKEYIKWMYKNK